jgi:hypothetical protein
MQKEEEEKRMNNGESGDEAIENQIQLNKSNEGTYKIVYVYVCVRVCVYASVYF